jgi:hypothetical protein
VKVIYESKLIICYKGGGGGLWVPTVLALTSKRLFKVLFVCLFVMTNQPVRKAKNIKANEGGFI